MKYTALQAHALGQWLHANSKDFPQYRGIDVRHLDYNGQRGLIDASEKYFRTKFGKTVEQVMDEVSAFQARQANPQKHSSVQDNGAVAVRIIDLGKQGKPAPPAANTLYRVLCPGCDAPLNVTQAELQQQGGQIVCPKCLQNAVTVKETLQKTFAEFTAQVPQYYNHPANNNAMKVELDRRLKLAGPQGFVPTADSWLDCYLAIKSQVLGRINLEQLDAMSSLEISEREKIDPELGGALEALNASAKPGETLTWSSNRNRFGDSFQRQGSR